MFKFFRVSFLIVMLATPMAFSCANGPTLAGIGIKSKSSKKSGDSNQPVVDTINKISEDSTRNKNEDRTVTGSGFMVKDSSLLRSAINDCLGANLTKINQPMIQVPGAAAMAPDAQGKFPFLGAGYAANEDIVTIESKSLGDPENLERGTVLASGPTPGYFQSLANVANVVAYNCNLDAADSKCNCRGEANARSLLKRCLTQFSDAEIEAKVAVFSNSCGQSPLEARKALANLVASGAFAAK